METPLVSARIPQDQKDRAAVILSEIGASNTDLIRAAFDYVIETHQLPKSESSGTKRTPKDFLRFVEETTFEVPWDADADYKEIVRKGKRADYEALT